MKLSANFNLSEFNCRDGSKLPAELIPNLVALAAELEKLRELLGEPIHINSGYRSPAYNKKVGGKPKSYHLTAKAADITVKSMTAKVLSKFIIKEIAAGRLNFGGVGTYPGFVHVDIGPKGRRW